MSVVNILWKIKNVNLNLQDEDEEELEGVFFNDMWSLDLEKGKWFPVHLR